VLAWKSRTLSPCLPQNAPPRARRAREETLKAARARYAYAHEVDNPLGPVPVAGRFPRSESYALRWALPFLPNLVRSLLATGRYRLRALLEDVVGRRGAEGLSDAAFARSWLDGPNPLILERLRDRARLDARLGISDAELQRVLPGASIAAELAAGRLYLVDYALIEEALLQGGRDSRWREKYLPAPVVLLCERAGVDPLCDLVPVAIRIDPRGAREPNPLYLRAPTPAWELAKLFACVADYNHQALSGHIHRHHYLAEPFAVSTPRQLAPEHPLRVLLEPHVAFTIAVNHAAFGLLKTPGSIFDQLYAGTLVETRRIMARSHERFAALRGIETDFVARGMADGLSDFPFRDDARLWSAALDAFVSRYVRFYYPDDRAVRDDWELSAWTAELEAPSGGALHGLVRSGRLESRDELAALLAAFLFAAGPGHAALHFPQQDFLTHVDVHPAAAYQPPPREEANTLSLAATLPPRTRGMAQTLNTHLAHYRFDRFGDYRAHRLGRVPAARPIVTRLRAELRHIERTIEERNRRRPRPYRYLLPSLVPNSINI
jgi:arachidonate 15-lipoxygenase